MWCGGWRGEVSLLRHTPYKREMAQKDRHRDRERKAQTERHRQIERERGIERETHRDRGRVEERPLI